MNSATPIELIGPDSANALPFVFRLLLNGVIATSSCLAVPIAIPLTGPLVLAA